MHTNTNAPDLTDSALTGLRRGTVPVLAPKALILGDWHEVWWTYSRTSVLFNCENHVHGEVP